MEKVVLAPEDIGRGNGYFVLTTEGVDCKMI